MINATQIRRGMLIVLEGQLFRVLEAIHVTPGRWKAMMQTKLRNIKDGSLLNHRFRSEDRVEQAFLEEVEMEFLYKVGEDSVFMNLENYEQIRLSPEIIGDGVNYLVSNIVFTIELYEGRPVAVRPSLVVELKVIKTAPFMKGATQSASSKPATLETGLIVTVPQFINEGDVVRIDTRDDKYVERAKTG
jgi:elongation factor P